MKAGMRDTMQKMVAIREENIGCNGTAPVSISFRKIAWILQALVRCGSFPRRRLSLFFFYSVIGNLSPGVTCVIPDSTS